MNKYDICYMANEIVRMETFELFEGVISSLNWHLNVIIVAC
jgi:hypothetical protein